MINEIIKLLFLAILIAIGIIFVSDGFMDKINQSINDIKNYGREVWQQQAPRIQQDFATQAAETFNELKKMFQNGWQICWDKIISWIWDKIPKNFCVQQNKHLRDFYRNFASSMRGRDYCLSSSYNIALDTTLLGDIINNKIISFNVG